MNYPTPEEIQQASLNQLQDWYANLPSPGFTSTHLPQEPFLTNLHNEQQLILMIIRKLYQLKKQSPESTT